MMIRPRISTGRPLTALVIGLVALAWISLAIWDRSPYGHFLSHEELSEVSLAGPSSYLGLLAAFVGGWTIMTAAMMLPTTLPLVALFQAVISHRSDRGRLVLILIGGYLLIWAVVGSLLHASDMLIHLAVESNHFLSDNAWLIPAATFIAAGGYQFSSLKYLCLEKCRSPFSFVVEHWRGGHAALDALRLGLHHGLFCAGCCWILMLLMFAFGVGNLAWMLVLGAVMAIEKNASWGKKLTRPLGVILLTIGLTVILLNLGLTTACAHETAGC